MNIPTLTSCEPRLAQSALTNYSVRTISIMPWTNCHHPSGGMEPRMFIRADTVYDISSLLQLKSMH